MDDCGNRDPLGAVACGILLILMAIGLVLVMEPAPRVGDGCEYFLMTMSLAEKGQPYSDPEVLAMYEAYQQSRDGSFLTGRDLEVYSNGLTLNGQRDFPHFWFFSLLCVPYYWFLKVLGGDIGHCFTLLNLTLLGLLLKVASANFGRRGLVVATALALASPLLWFVNKGHTEFFTVCLATTGVIWFLKKQYGRTVLALGIVSTQNPPFLLVALLVVALGIVRGGPKMVRHGVGCLAGMLVGCLHPLYYFIRHGNVTPQLITGAASGEGKGFREWTCFIVDPDVGLFSNWPWLIVPLIAVLAVTFWKKQKPDWS
ncbi:MAG: hypothetical protein VX768_17040, partial [Planctomycetota bacterium]|nr:hypothetical protein [Planctomycetota bacterium]